MVSESLAMSLYMIEHQKNLSVSASRRNGTCSKSSSLFSMHAQTVAASVKAGVDAISDPVPVVEEATRQAVCLAQKADTVILALGCHPMVCAKEEIDRTTLAEKISKASPNAVCILFSNYPYTIHTIQNRLPAILWSATGSQDMGTAMAKTLYGQNAPAGRLNMTWYNSDDDLPDIDDYDIVRHRRIYRYFDKEVLYPFGYGLTYTEFAYSNLSVQMADPCHIEISFDVKNIGECVSDEVVQIYASAPKSRVPKPRRQLLAFERLYDILPQETRHVTKRVNARFC